MWPCVPLHCRPDSLPLPVPETRAANEQSERAALLLRAATSLRFTVSCGGIVVKDLSFSLSCAGFAILRYFESIRDLVESRRTLVDFG